MIKEDQNAVPHGASRTEVFDIALDPFYETIVDYERYSEFVEHVKRVEVLSEKKGVVRARFTLGFIIDVSYTLDLYHDYPNGISWELVGGDLFKTMSGSWALKPKGKKKTEVTYTAEVHPKVMAPRLLVRTLVKSSLPKMMRAFYERAKQSTTQA